MNAETIKEFLISLGFAVDDAGAKKFDAVIAGVTANVFKMAGTVEAAAGTVLLFTTKIAAGLDSLYWASQRTGASVAGIKALGYAASQTGSSAESARGSLESLSRFMRNNPGAEGFLNRLGVQTRDASGNMRDMSAVFTGIGQQLSKMPYYRANQYAQMLGIDENTLMAMRRGLAGFNADYSAMAKAIGFNADQAAVGSNKFMTSLRGFSAMAGMARDKIGSNLANGLAGSIDNLRKQILDNFPKIEETITNGVKGLLWLADTIGRVVYRLIQAAGDVHDWWGSLDKDTQKLIATFGGLVVAWRVLNSAFLMSPIGIISLLAGALLLLYDDYKVWKEGGKHLIDWDKWEPAIKKAQEAIGWMRDKLLELKDSVGGWKTSLEILAGFMAVTWSIRMIKAITGVTAAMGALFKFSGRMLAVGIAIELFNKVDEVEKAAKAAGTSVGEYLAKKVKDTESNKKPLLTFGEIGSWISKKLNLHTGNDGLLPSGGLAGGMKRSQATVDGADQDNNQPEQHAQSVRKVKHADLSGTVAGQFNETIEKIKSQKFADNFTDALLRLVNRAAPQALPSVTPAASSAAEITPPKSSAAGNAMLAWLSPTLNKLENLYHLPDGLLKSVAITESAGDPNAISGAGAQGLFQLMPGTAKDMGLRGNDAFDPVKSAQAAAKYLAQLLKTNHGDLQKTLASYNWGIGNVQKYGMGLMPQETRNYVPRVLSNMPGGVKGASIQQATTININGVSDPMRAGKEVVDRQTGVNSRLTQQVAAGAR